MLARIATWLESPRTPLACALVALLLSSPSLLSGLQTDDHLYIDGLERGAPWLSFFRLTPQTFAQGQAAGTMGWWNGPDLRIAFMRPLAELSHRLDFALFGDRALLMHLENMLLYALMAWLAARVFRRLLPARTAGLAALLFVLNGAHGNSVGWISGRNTLLAALFGIATVLTYLHAREHRGARLASPLLLALALASAEGGLATLAYLVAHALVLAEGRPRERLRPLLPHAVVTLTWAALYVAGGYGAHGAAWYRDPSSQPVATLVGGLVDMPAWLFSQLGISMVEVLLAAPQQARLIPVLLLLPILWLLMPVVRGNRTARFFATGMLLSIVPLFTTLPQDRLLMAASLGGFGLLACAFATIADSASRARRISLRTLATLHLVLSPLTFAQAVTSRAPLEGASRALAGTLPAEPGRDVVLVRSPLGILTFYATTIQRRQGDPQPATLHQLYAGGADLEITRTGGRTLEVRARPGWCNRPIECIFRSPGADWRVGKPVQVGPIARTVLETDHGRPTLVRFEFEEPLESERYAFRVWEGTAPVPWRLPGVGATETLAALNPLTSLKR